MRIAEELTPPINIKYTPSGLPPGGAFLHFWPLSKSGIANKADGGAAVYKSGEQKQWIICRDDDIMPPGQ